jgi:hypothetical protein
MVLLWQAFAVAGTIPDADLDALPAALGRRVRNLAATACRRGTREELVRGTVYYCAVLAALIPLFGTAPVNVLTVACLGPALASPPLPTPPHPASSHAPSSSSRCAAPLTYLSL